MQLNNQIQKYRSSMNLSQEELAEKVSVTKQTISNWENNKSYPDINSLLLLSSVFGISLDQLIDLVGFIIAAAIYGATMYFAVKSEKRATKCDIQTYKEIVAYIEEQTSSAMDKTLVQRPKILLRLHPPSYTS